MLSVEMLGSRPRFHCNAACIGAFEDSALLFRNALMEMHVYPREMTHVED